MFKFLKESKKEFEHVVRPTNKETKKYFSIVTGLIVVLTIFLYIVGTSFSAGLFALKDAVNPAKLQQLPTKNKLPTSSLLGSGSTGAINLSGSTVVPTFKTSSTGVINSSGSNVVPTINNVASGAAK